MTKRPVKMQQKTVLMFHAQYRILGGEERSFDEEATLLEEIGYNVVRFELPNALIRSNPISALAAVFNPAIFIRVIRLIKNLKPQLIYVNNLWPALSPAVLLAARISAVPTLQALRNYRLVCPSAKLDNLGNCLNCGASTFPFRCIANGCYNGSRIQSALVAGFSVATRVINAGRGNHFYLATSRITKDLLVRHGVPQARIRVRPNFLLNSINPSFKPGVGVIYVGRLSEEKGIAELIECWQKIENAPLLTLVGNGPLAKIAEAASASHSSKVRWIGAQPASVVLTMLQDSVMSIVPSQWAEPFGRAAIESMSAGTPVIHTDGGALPEIVGDGGIQLTGLTAAELSKALAVTKNSSELIALRHKAFDRYRARFGYAAAAQDMRDHIEAVGAN